LKGACGEDLCAALRPAIPMAPYDRLSTLGTACEALSRWFVAVAALVACATLAVGLAISQRHVLVGSVAAPSAKLGARIPLVRGNVKRAHPSSCAFGNFEGLVREGVECLCRSRDSVRLADGTGLQLRARDASGGAGRWPVTRMEVASVDPGALPGVNVDALRSLAEERTPALDSPGAVPLRPYSVPFLDEYADDEGDGPRKRGYWGSWNNYMALAVHR